MISVRALVRIPHSATPARGKRILALLLFIPLFGLFQALHWLVLLLDEIFFPGYRRVEVREPVFVVGVPRSGTTFLHRTLARDPQFTTFSTWEAWFGFSVTARRCILALAALDNRIGRPAHRLIRGLERRLAGGLDNIHEVGLEREEEDYFVLMPVLACFILMLPFPQAKEIWQLAHFDQQVPEADRRRLMRFYRACLQKHLYVHGTDRHFLSKNASFSPMVRSLVETFPDARLVCCVRDPRKTVPSQLSSLESGFAFFGVDPVSSGAHDRMQDALLFYYEHLGSVIPTLPPPQRAVVNMKDLKQNLVPTICALYDQLELPLSRGFLQTLGHESEKGRAYRSQHHYAAGDFDLQEDDVARDFSRAYELFSFQPKHGADAPPDAPGGEHGQETTDAVQSSGGPDHAESDIHRSA